MSNLLGAMIGAALDRRDGDVGIKGMIIGTLAERAIRSAAPLAATFALGWVVQYAVHKGWTALAGEAPFDGRTDAKDRPNAA